MKPMIWTIAGICIIILMIPTLLVLPTFQGKPAASQHVVAEPSVKKEVKGSVKLKQSPVAIPVYRSAHQQVENIPLEEYVIGVVASEMPADFEMEALKAQALAARTYIVRQMISDKTVKSPKGSLVDDTQMFQVYKNKQELKKIWGKAYNWKLKKVTEAVASTQGKVLTYDEKPIDASFFSTSNGKTENAEAYWKNEIPYLKSVSSKWDEKSPKFQNKKTISVSEFQQKLGVTLTQQAQVGQIVERTPGNQVAKAVINGKTLSGRDIRESLGLHSADFTWERKGQQIVITTKGYGHGVGMSQYGAHYMAQAGKKVDAIVKHYYKGIQIESADRFLNTYMAKK
ncbi:stage II sporulation protein D [Bacillus safensis]|uniref:stage II sporulation protein D n=1 Tax=Bacillus safensis TaxID=561879 RepID=UPI000B432626|nr:stage II sporulation protein D [Bacillus safensis]MCY7492520.1 stage II sporulation protein D [Bacillus safensis]MED4994547.1 stage II sporulation protein D [Bacillus safensis]UDB49376.1 stage II sporulation protein D [Bacillus safensis]